MIHIHTRRAGLFVIASVVNDFHEITATVGLTVRGAENRLMRRMDRRTTS